MTKAEVVREISNQTGVEKAVVLKTIEAYMETIKDSLEDSIFR
jgi:DNA-binding protein HU-beta